MDLGTIYPSMKEFRMAVRQFAINEEFDLGTEKSDPTRFRGFCKSTGDCPWKINGSKHKGASTVEVKIFLCSSNSDYLLLNLLNLFHIVLTICVIAGHSFN